MLRLGAPPEQMREMDPDDLFSFRLKLLIVMVKASLGGYPVGLYRKRAVADNADFLQRDAGEMGRQVRGPTRRDGAEEGDARVEYAFYRNVCEFAALAKGLATEPAFDFRRRETLERLLDLFSEAISLDHQMGEYRFIQVA